MSVSQDNSNSISASGGGGGNADIRLFVEGKPRAEETIIQAWQRMLNEETIKDINVKYRGMTALMYQSAAGTIENMKWLLEHGANPNIQDSDGKTSLRWALESSDHIDDKINLLLQNGAEPNIKDNKGVTPLDAARKDMQLASAVAILEKAINSSTLSERPRPPVNVNQSSNISSEATGVKTQENINKFVRANGTNTFVINLWTKMKTDGTMPDINARDSLEGLTAIMFQTIHGTIETMKWLLQQPGINVNLKSKNGNTALMMATKNNKPDKVKLLLENGADQSIANNAGETPLSFAQRVKFDEINTLLTEPVISTSLGTSSSTSLGTSSSTSLPPVTNPSSSTSLGPSASSIAAAQEQTPIVKNFLKLSPIKMNQKDKNGKVVLSNRLIYIGPIEVKEPKLFNVTGADGKITPYLINIILISDSEGRLEQRQSSLSPDDIDWSKIALPSNFDANPTKDELPDNENQWVSYNIDYIFAALANNTNTSAVLSKNFSNEMVQGFFQPDYTEDIMFNKPNLERLQRQTFKQLVIFFNALMETLDQIYTHSISSVLNPEKKQCITDTEEPSTGPSSSPPSGPSSVPTVSNDQQLLDQIEKFYNAGKMKEILTLEGEVNGVTDVQLRTEMELYILLAKFETNETIDLNTIRDLLNRYINIIDQFLSTDIKTKCTRLIFKIVFYTYQDQRIKEWFNTLLSTGSVNLVDLNSNLNIINTANFLKQIMKNDPNNPAFATVNPDVLKTESDDLMAEYDIKLTAMDKTDYENEIADTMAAAKKAKSDLKWTLAELLYTRAHQFAVVYFGYGSPEEGVALAEKNTFVDLNRKNGSGLIKFVGDLLSQLTTQGSVYTEFISTDDSKNPVIPNNQNIATFYRRQIDAVITSELSTRITKTNLFEEVPSNETEKQMPGAIIGALIGILSNMIIQMTLYIYIVNQLRIKDINNVNSDNNELILLFNILAGLKIAERRIIQLSSEQNKNLGQNDDDFEETKVDSEFLNKMMASVLASGSMLGVIGLVAIGGRKNSRKKRRVKGLNSRRLNNKNKNKNKSSRKGRTRRYLKKIKTTIKLRKHRR